MRPAEVCIAQVGFTEVGFAQVGPNQACLIEMRLAQIYLA